MNENMVLGKASFSEIISIIDAARAKARKAVNAERIQMYWDVGEHLSDLCAKLRIRRQGD